MNARILGVLLVLSVAQCFDAALEIAPQYKPWKTDFACRYQVNIGTESYVFQAVDDCIFMNTYCYPVFQAVDDNCTPLNRFMYIQTAGWFRLQWSIDNDLTGGWEDRLGVVDYFDLCNGAKPVPRKVMGAKLWMNRDYTQVGTIIELQGNACSTTTTPSITDGPCKYGICAKGCVPVTEDTYTCEECKEGYAYSEERSRCLVDTCHVSSSHCVKGCVALNPFELECEECMDGYLYLPDFKQCREV